MKCSLPKYQGYQEMEGFVNYTFSDGLVHVIGMNAAMRFPSSSIQLQRSIMGSSLKDRMQENTKES